MVQTDRKRTTGRDIRRQNRSALLSELFFNGPLSRLELAEITGLSPATASNVTAELFGERLIIEAGQVESDGGRPRVLLRVDPTFGHVIGVVVAEAGVRVELFDLAMQELARVEELGDPQPDTVADLIVAGINRVIEIAAVDPNGVIGIGIGVPGVVEQGSTAVIYAPTIGWNGVRLGQMLRDRGIETPVFVENGAKTLGQAEMWFGAGRGAGHAVIVLIGTGVGAAVFTDGIAYQGVSSSAGEWGHTTINFGGRPCRCGARGCLEAYIGAEAILDRYRESPDSAGAQPLIGADNEAQITALVEAAPSSPAAADVLNETADLIGAGIADLINLYNPERVLVGGWAGLVLGRRLLTRIRQSAASRALPHLFEQVRIELGTLGQDAVALGAATLPVAALLAAAADPRPNRGY